MAAATLAQEIGQIMTSPSTATPSTTSVVTTALLGTLIASCLTTFGLGMTNLVNAAEAGNTSLVYIWAIVCVVSFAGILVLVVVRLEWSNLASLFSSSTTTSSAAATPLASPAPAAMERVASDSSGLGSGVHN